MNRLQHFLVIIFVLLAANNVNAQFSKSVDDFESSTKSRKKGGWDVEVKPKDQRNYQSLYITVSEDGYTTVNINCIDRQPISYYGYIEAVQKL